MILVCAIGYGYERSESWTGCVICEQGTYKGTPGDEECTPCGSNQDTNSTGSTDVSQCRK